MGPTTHRLRAGGANSAGRGQLAALTLLVAASLLTGCGAGTPREVPFDGPNIVLVVVDTLRADHLSEYGFSLPTTPALADFMSEAVRFEQAYAAGSWTRPSVASILSGLVPTRHQVRAERAEYLPESVATLPEILRERGYRTRGHSHNINVSPKRNFDQGFEEFYAYDGGVLAYPDISEMNDDVIEWIAPRDEPFFLYLQPMNPHGPYRVPQEHRSTLLGRPPSREYRYQSPIETRIMSGRLEFRWQVEPQMITSLREQYAVAVRYTMDQLAAVFEALREAGEWDDSIVVLTSDHGEELFEHGGFRHGFTLFEESIHVPLLVKLPREVSPARRTIAEPVSLVDLTPTLLDLAGIPPSRELDGISLARLLRSEHEVSGLDQREILVEADLEARCVGRALVHGGYKLVLLEDDYTLTGERLFLFDLDADPGDREDLSESLPEVVADLRARLDRFVARADAAAVALDDDSAVEPLDEETLRALGYL